MTPQQKTGLYRPEFEHDACGIGFVCDVSNRPSHSIVTDGIEILNNLVHRGASGANPTTGDGAGILIQIPDALLRSEVDFDLPALGNYGVGMCFLPQEDERRVRVKRLLTDKLAEANLSVLGWRDVPTNSSILNDYVRSFEPVIEQVFIVPSTEMDVDLLELKFYLVRRLVSQALKRMGEIDSDPAGYYIPSMSCRTLVYKGMFLAHQLEPYYADLSDKRTTSALALAHQRFSTNTFPSWKLAHPYRVLAHNGEINTARGNVNNMISRQQSLVNERWGDDLKSIYPLIAEGLSDTGSLDNCMELLMVSGYSPAQAAAMLIPEAWQGNPDMDLERKAFYEHHAIMMEPWDGPALVAFTDGRQIGALLDRNGLRPARYIETKDGRVVMASEVGVLEIPENEIAHKWRLEPGRMLLVDLVRGRLISDTQIKQELSTIQPFAKWVGDYQIGFNDLPEAADKFPQRPSPEEQLKLQLAFGYTLEDLKFILEPMVTAGQEPVGSMGDDTPVSVLSDQPCVLSRYFRQEFAQVTNPAIDPIREELVMSTHSYLGRRPNLLLVNGEPSHKVLRLESPVLTVTQLQQILGLNANDVPDRLGSEVLDITYTATSGWQEMTVKLERLCKKAQQLVENGVTILVLSDRNTGPDRVAIPALLAISAVHHHLIDAGLRTQTGLVADTASAREVHDFAVLIGFGAEAICPYLAYWTLEKLHLRNGDKSRADRVTNYRAAVRKGLLKVMSKMGVSTIQSFCGAQLFEAVGLGSDFIDKYFCRAITQIEGIGIDEVSRNAHTMHARAFGLGQLQRLDQGGDYAYRESGERHMWTPGTVANLQHAVRTNSVDTYEKYARLINRQDKRLMTLRGMLRFGFAKHPIPLDEVEPASEIVRRFSTGAMSLGSISTEAHTTLAIAMNRIGGKSNTGEGGEDPKRFIPLANGDSKRSAIKQVASGRFGVTIEYLVNSDMMQIKIAQGAKPGEGGQLPGHKVDSFIAKTRHSVPGVGLISPPPHHDIYSIEDIAQLIHDLKNANPDGAVSVKLVSRYGVGTVAAGVAKAKSDHITIAGHDGGTGASPLSSIKHAGTPWELGLSETHQTLVLNDLRGRVVLQVDGQIKTGRDVVIGALLGADEFGFATAPLVAEGCIMMRKCHLNTCPVGIATQDPRLRKKFAGKPEHVVNYFFFVAEEVRVLMAKFGLRTFDEMIGRSDLLSADPPQGYAAKLDLGPLLTKLNVPKTFARHHCQAQEHGLEKALDNQLIKQALPAIETGAKTVIETKVRNSNRTLGTIMSSEIAKIYGNAGLADDTLTINATGSVGQSFGCFLAKGITLNLIGDANDYAGKGMSGGIIAMRPADVGRVDGDNIISGNVNLYGAVAGEAYFRGGVGERFAVRNSGATAVVERVGDHGCEYMTGGTVIVLGPVGRNFAAGMSGGVAYVLDEDGTFANLCNLAMVELEKPTDTVVDISHLGRSDYDLLHTYITAHQQRTGSPKAKQLLDNWQTSLAKFVKIMPLEYRRALTELVVKTKQVAKAA